MIKRPLDKRFNAAVLTGKKFTTIRGKPWPVGVPIMLYNWSCGDQQMKYPTGARTERMTMSDAIEQPTTGNREPQAPAGSAWTPTKPLYASARPPERLWELMHRDGTASVARRLWDNAFTMRNDGRSWSKDFGPAGRRIGKQSATVEVSRRAQRNEPES